MGRLFSVSASSLCKWVTGGFFGFSEPEQKSGQRSFTQFGLYRPWLEKIYKSQD
jgi:hypothetical protein